MTRKPLQSDIKHFHRLHSSRSYLNMQMKPAETELADLSVLSRPYSFQTSLTQMKESVGQLADCANHLQCNIDLAYHSGSLEKSNVVLFLPKEDSNNLVVSSVFNMLRLIF